MCIILKDRVYYDSLFNSAQYSEWGVSEWMINYEGGFVRRGLMGQVIWFMSNISSSSPITLIKTISFTSAFIFLLVVFRIFSRERWSLFILPLGCCLYFTLFSLWARKDFIVLLLCLSVFGSCKKYLVTKSTLWLLLFWLCSAIMLLTHEASFFYTYPIILLYVYYYYHTGKINIKIRDLLLTALPIIILMSTVCFYKGNSLIAKDIWQSWQGCFNLFPDVHGTSFDSCHVGTGVNALTWSTISTIQFHLSKNYPNPCVFFLACWMFIAYFYIVSNLNSIDLSFNSCKCDNQSLRISNTLLPQAIFMIPLFTILSCDIGRTLSWWIFSSLFAVYVFGDLNLAPIVRCSNCLQKIYQKVSRICPYIYVLLVLTVPFAMVNGPTLDNIWMYRIIKSIILHL